MSNETNLAQISEKYLKKLLPNVSSRRYFQTCEPSLLPEAFKKLDRALTLFSLHPENYKYHRILVNYYVKGYSLGKISNIESNGYSATSRSKREALAAFYKYLPPEER